MLLYYLVLLLVLTTLMYIECLINYRNILKKKKLFELWNVNIFLSLPLAVVLKDENHLWQEC